MCLVCLLETDEKRIAVFKLRNEKHFVAIVKYYPNDALTLSFITEANEVHEIP